MSDTKENKKSIGIFASVEDNYNEREFTEDEDEENQNMMDHIEECGTKECSVCEKFLDILDERGLISHEPLGSEADAGLFCPPPPPNCNIEVPKGVLLDCIAYSKYLETVLDKYFPGRGSIMVVTDYSVSANPSKIVIWQFDGIPVFITCEKRKEKGLYKISFNKNVSPSLAGIVSVALRTNNFACTPYDDFHYSVDENYNPIFEFDANIFNYPLKFSDDSADKDDEDLDIIHNKKDDRIIN